MLQSLFRKGADQAVSLVLLLLLLASHSVVGGSRGLTHVTSLLLSCSATLLSGAFLSACRLVSSGLPLNFINFRHECEANLDLYGFPTYLVTLLAAFFDGAPENMSHSMHIIGGTDWRYWIAFGVLLATRRAIRSDDDFGGASWLLVVIPALFFWFIHIKLKSLCWDFVIGDLLGRLGVLLSQSNYHNWRLKFLIGFAILSVLRLSTYHCDPRIARHQPSALSSSQLMQQKEGLGCLANIETSLLQPVRECWSGQRCYDGSFKHSLKHGSGKISGVLSDNVEGAMLQGNWMNGFASGSHQLKPFDDSMYFVGGLCVNGSCLNKVRPGTYRRRASILLSEYWTVEDVSAWLDDMGMPATYKQAFAVEKITGTELLTPQLLDEEYLLLLNISIGDSVRLATHIYNLQKVHKTHQQELLVIAEGLVTPACSLTSHCFFFGNVYPKIRRNLLASLNLPSKSVLFDAVWHMIEMMDQMNWHHSVPHTVVHSRKKTSPQVLLVKEWSKRFHLAWPSGVLTEHAVLEALNIDERVFITMFYHLTGSVWSSTNLRWYFLLLMDLDGNFAVDFSEFSLFVRAYSHFYPLQQRTTHLAKMESLWPGGGAAGGNTYYRESILFHALRLSLDQSLLGGGTCQKFASAFVSSNTKAVAASDTVLSLQPSGHTYYGYDSTAS